METLTIKQPDFCSSLGDEVWQYLVHDLKNDREWQKLTRKYYEVYAELEAAKTITHKTHLQKKLEETKTLVNNRVITFSQYWIRKYGSAELSFKEVLSVLEGEDREKFILRANTVMFLADFMEDCFMDMNDFIRKYLPDAKVEYLKHFFEAKKQLSTYTLRALDDAGENYTDLFDEHAAALKMTIYNKVNGFINANDRRIKEEESKQLTFEFKE